MNANQITTVETFGIETLDKAINDAVLHMSGTKSLAIDFLKIQELASGTDRLKTYKFPALIERIFKGQYDGSTAYKYALCAQMFAEQPDIWDFYSISKLQILMNCENSTAIKEGKSAYDFHVWYADSINRAKNDKVAEWEIENEKILAKIESTTDDETVNLWREKLTPRPDDGFDIPDKNTVAYKEYAEIMFVSARKALTTFTDTALRDLVRVYRGSDTLVLNTATGKADKVEGTEKKSGKKEENVVMRTPDELRQDAHAALLAYTSTFDKVPKTLASALELLAKGGDK